MISACAFVGIVIDREFKIAELHSDLGFLTGRRKRLIFAALV